MGYEIKPEKKVHTSNWNKENFLDKAFGDSTRLNYIGKINVTMSGLRRAGRKIRRGNNPFIGKHYNQIRKQVSIITGKPYISHWLRKENR